MGAFEDCLSLLDDLESEALDALEMEQREVKEEDSMLREIEYRLEQIADRMLELDVEEEPDMDEVTRLYSEYLELSSKQSLLTDCIDIGVNTIGLLEEALY